MLLLAPVSQLFSSSLGLVRNLELLQDSRFPSGTVFFSRTVVWPASRHTASLRHSKGSFDQVCCCCCCCWNSLEFSSCIYLSWHSVRFVRSFRLRDDIQSLEKWQHLKGKGREWVAPSRHRLPFTRIEFDDQRALLPLYAPVYFFFPFSLTLCVLSAQFDSWRRWNYFKILHCTKWWCVCSEAAYCCQAGTSLSDLKLQLNNSIWHNWIAKWKEKRKEKRDVS